ncbi:hypothetical protein MP228_001195 [Amoeboaphelidium protococcarum]|nr:hypothetical protein MP228_001195 [Amoeboaphelidium protococcarum]
MKYGQQIVKTIVFMKSFIGDNPQLLEEAFTFQTLHGPRQNNGYDCGVYILADIMKTIDDIDDFPNCCISVPCDSIRQQVKSRLMILYDLSSKDLDPKKLASIGRREMQQSLDNESRQKRKMKQDINGIASFAKKSKNGTLDCFLVKKSSIKGQADNQNQSTLIDDGLAVGNAHLPVQKVDQNQIVAPDEQYEPSRDRINGSKLDDGDVVDDICGLGSDMGSSSESRHSALISTNSTEDVGSTVDNPTEDVGSTVDNLQSVQDVGVDELPFDDCLRSGGQSALINRAVCDDTTSFDQYCSKSTRLDGLTVVDNDLSLKFALKLGPVQVSKNHVFPVGGDGRKCNFKWFKSYYDKYRLTLEYCAVNDLMFCYHCRLFSYQRNSLNQGKLTSGYQNWTNIYSTAAEHQESQEHLDCLTLFSRHKCLQDDPTLQLHVQLQKQSQQQILAEQEAERLREYNVLVKHDVIKLLIQLGMPFRGHDESEDSVNRGLYLGILDLIAKHCDSYAKSLPLMYGNATYTSPSIQNEMTAGMVNSVLKLMVQSIEKSRFFSLMVDETTDNCGQYQIAVCVRYLVKRKKYLVEERLVDLSPVTEKTGLALSYHILRVLEDLRIDARNIVGQCYDGASNMRGEFKGVQAEIRKTAPKSVYIWCSAHRLNLLVGDVSKGIKQCIDLFATIDSVVGHIRSSPCRMHALNGYIDQMRSDQSFKVQAKTTMQSICDTRWTSRSGNLEVFANIYPALIQYFKSENVSQSFIRDLQRVTVIASLFLLQPLYKKMQWLSETLQSSQLDFLQMMSEVESFKIWLLQMKSNNSQCSAIYTTSVEYCRLIDGDLKAVNKHKFIFDCVQQAAKALPVYEDYTLDNFRSKFYIPVYEAILDHLEQRFESQVLKAFQEIQKLVRFDSDLKIDFDIISEQFDLSQSNLIDEYDMVQAKVAASQITLECNVVILLNQLVKHNLIREASHPTLIILLSKVAVIAVNSAECERSFSALNQVNNQQRKTQTGDRLNNLMVGKMNNDLLKMIDTDAAKDAFLAKSDRRLHGQRKK